MNPWPLAILTAAGGLWFLARPAVDPVRLRARSTGPLSTDDWQAHAVEVERRPAKWARERTELANYRPKAEPIMHLIRTVGRVG